jgi:hypothetical protein
LDIRFVTQPFGHLSIDRKSVCLSVVVYQAIVDVVAMLPEK